MWAKRIRWGLRGFVGLVLLAFGLNFWVLWFHPVPQEWVELYRHEDPFVRAVMHNVPISKAQQSLPEDAAGEAMFERLMECIDIVSEYRVCGVEMAMDPDSQAPVRPSMSREDHRRLVELWTGLPEDARLNYHIPVSWDVQGRLKLIPYYLIHGGEQQNNFAGANMFISLDDMVDRTAKRVERLRIAESTARWNQLIMEAFDPTPEHSYVLNSIVDFTGRTFELFEANIERMDDLAALEPALSQFVSIRFDEVEELSLFTQNIVRDHSFTFKGMDTFALQFSWLGFYRAQCRIMQSFFPEGSDAYYRYDILARMREMPPRRLFEQRSSYNAPSAFERMKQAQAQQALAQGALELIEHMQAGRLLAEFSPKAIDPYTDAPIRFEHDGETIRFISAGPSLSFDGGVYSPTNGLISEGDIVLAVRR